MQRHPIVLYLSCILGGLLLGTLFLWAGESIRIALQPTLSSYTIEELREQRLRGFSQQFGSSDGSGSQLNPDQTYMVYGYLPYWNMSSANLHPAQTHISYFGLFVDESGRFLQEPVGDGMGFRTFNASRYSALEEAVLLQSKKLEITIVMVQSDTIANFLSSTTAQDRLIEQLKVLANTQPISGLNIDIEYAGQVTPALRRAYVEFIRRVAEEIRDPINAGISPNQDPFHLSIAVFGGSASNANSFWDLVSLEPLVDSIIIMAYDYHLRGSTIAGPVSPLFGSSSDRLSEDIMRHISDFFKIIPGEKLVLGIPFYGYEWRTVSAVPGSPTFPNTGAVATYKRIRELLLRDDVHEQWDTTTLTPYITYQEEGQTRFITYENSQSIAFKLDLVRQTGMKGVAVWAMGYEGEYLDLWEVIEQKLR